MAEHRLTVKFTDLFRFQTIAELPLNSLAFSKALNTPGAWSGTLPIEDRRGRRSAWIQATNVNRSAMWVDIDGVLLYGGRTTGRDYEMTSGTMALSGTDFLGY